MRSWGSILRIWWIVGLLCLLAGCTSERQLTARQARATAEVAGCWPYGAVQPQPSATPVPMATSVLRPPDAPTATSVVTPEAPWPIYPMCTPAPLTPTMTSTPTATPVPYLPPTPQPRAAVGALDELQDATGVVRQAGLAWAYHPVEYGPIVAWINWAWRPDEEDDGEVWITSRDAFGAWRDPQTLNLEPVIRNYGRVAVAAAPDMLRVIYGSGLPAGSTLYEVISTDHGRTWTLPVAIGTGAIHGLVVDQQGVWHAVSIGPQPLQGQVRYGVAHGTGGWTWTEVPGATDTALAALALLELEGETIRILATARQNPTPQVQRYRSVDGLAWDVAAAAPMPGRAFGAPERLQLLAVPRGEGLVATAWSNFGAGMVVASISTDGGRSYGPIEILAQHRDDAAITSEDHYGVDPSLAYDPVGDALVASWIEVRTDLPVYPYATRSYLARRPLEGHALGQPWLDAMTPATHDQMRYVLDPQRRAFVMALPDGSAAGVILIDERNYQWRMLYRTVELPALTLQPQS